MKITVLEHPRIASREHFNDIANTPLWSCLMGGYATAALAAGGHDVRYLDAAGRGLTFEEILPKILQDRPDLLCVNAVYFWEYTPALFAFLDRLKDHGYRGHINLFGFFPSQVYNEILTGCPGVDSIAVGECEQTLADLAAGLRSGRLETTVSGLAVRTGGKAVLPEIRKPALRPDIFPFPARDPQAAGTVSILGSRGCYNQCNFCPIPGFYNNGPLWRGRSPQNIVAEITSLMAVGHRDFYFVDPNFIGPGKQGRERAMTLARLLAPLAITFGMETRAADLTAELLAALRGAGLASLLLGAESGSASALSSMHKAQAPGVTARAIQLCRQEGIEPEIGFILFPVDSTLADIRASHAFLEENQLLDRLERTINLLSHRQIILKGTTGYAQYHRQGRLTPVGSFGFQGHVPFADPRVCWLAAVWLPLSRHILATMSNPGSPVYWKHAARRAHRTLNRQVTGLFTDMLNMAAGDDVLPGTKSMSNELRLQIDGWIGALEDHPAGNGKPPCGQAP